MPGLRLYKQPGHIVCNLYCLTQNFKNISSSFSLLSPPYTLCEVWWRYASCGGELMETDGARLWWGETNIYYSYKSDHIRWKPINHCTGIIALVGSIKTPKVMAEPRAKSI